MNRPRRHRRLLTGVALFSIIGTSLAAPVTDLDERFAVTSTGVISDSVTGLYWRVGPDRDIHWQEACSWVDSLPGDWRIPFRYELASLFSAGVRYGRWGPFENTGWLVWSIDLRSGPERHSFSFVPLDAYWWNVYSEFTGERVFAVQSSPARVLLSELTE